MTLKRQGAIQTYMSAPAAKRLRTVERKVNYLARRTNRKLSRANFIGASTLASGAIVVQALIPSGVTDWKCLYFSAAGSLNNPGVDVYLIQSKDGTAPVYGDFQPVSGGFLLGNDAGDKLVVWNKYYNTQGSTLFKMQRRFTKGFVMEQDSSTNPHGKQLYFVIKNNTGSTINYQFAIETWGHTMES